MKKTSFFTYLISHTHFIGYLMVLLVLAMFCLSSYWYVFFEHSKFDHSAKSIQFSYLISDHRGRNSHVFRAMSKEKEIMTFRSVNSVPDTKRLITDQLPKFKGGIAYYTETPGFFGISNIRSLLGVEFFSGIKIGQNSTPEKLALTTLNNNKKMALVTSLLLVLLLIIPPIYYKYKEKINEKVK